MEYSIQSLEPSLTALRICFSYSEPTKKKCFFPHEWPFKNHLHILHATHLKHPCLRNKPQNPFCVRSFTLERRMALKAVHVSDVPNLDQVQENAALPLFSSRLIPQCVNIEESDDTERGFKFGRFVVMGHRGSGMNMLQSCDRRMKSIKENSNSLLQFCIQVTKDDCPVIFHDNFILTEHKGELIEKRVTDLTLDEFRSYGPQNEVGSEGKSLFRKTKDGRIFEWKVEEDAPFCTLQEVFQKVDDTMGFNVELKFDDSIIYKEEELKHILQVILQVAFEHAKERPVIFSSFQPDAALLMRKLQSTYPVFFLTNGGSEIYTDVRRNSLDEAVKICTEGGLQGIVSEVKAVFRNPGAVTRIKEARLSLITYGQLKGGTHATPDGN
uniref:glycerophosphodiester phosphodiesterase n=2 Tax=Salix viminalis TaxID=40686 RepID=A0A6N2M4H8_SALVM